MTPETLIYDELNRLGISFKVQGSNFLVICPWHNDSRPSLSLHNSGTKARCWGCSWTGNWNKYAREIGARIMDENSINEGHVLAGKLDGIQDPNNPWGKNVLPRSANKRYAKDWRGISTDFLKKLDARVWYDDKAASNRILFPVRDISDKLSGWVAAREDPNDKTVNPKYLNMPRMPIDSLLYPISLVSGKNIVLVEGPFDAIRLAANGIPAVAIFGCGNWTEKKKRILVSKGIEKVFIAMDGDEAGQKSANKIAVNVENDFDTYILELPEGKDPGNVDETFLKWMKEITN